MWTVGRGPSAEPAMMLAFAPLALLAIHATVGATATRPNLMFMMTDQQRWDTMSAVTPSLATPNMDRIAKEGVLFKWGYSSTPTCTPARAAILTGQKPWNHGSLGAVNVAYTYPFEMPVTLVSLGYSTTSIGKDHFGWVSGPDGTVTHDGPDAGTCVGNGDERGDTLADGDGEGAAADVGQGFPPPYGPDKGYGVPHGYQQTSLYDGIVAEQDDYHQYFMREMGGKEPETGWPQLDMNSWRGEPYAYANESLHPTAWVGQQAVDFITDRAPFISNASFKDAPWFLKISFHRPHSPYDPPQRFIDKTPLSSLRPVYTCAKGDPLGWDDVFSDNSDANGCGPQKLDAWCGAMPANDSAFARRCYQANIAFIDEWVGKILDALTATAQLENTYIVWAGDHGDGQSDHYHWCVVPEHALDTQTAPLLLPFL
jgi:arylsulfatase